MACLSRLYPLAGVVLSFLAACGDSSSSADAGTATDDPSGATDGETDPTAATDDTTAGRTTGETEAEETETGSSEHVDLFACPGLVPSCEPMIFHIDPEPPSALECAGALVTSGEPGLLRALESVGPDIDEVDSIIVVLGDGTAIVQRRARHCDGRTEPCGDDLPWEPSSEHRLCTLRVDEALEAACDPECQTDCSCSWHPFHDGLADCQGVDDWTCEDVESALAGG